ncbi:MAG: glutathione S-transferase family protein [Polyangiales bacterium]
MRLADEDVTTNEVKSWRGVHLLHFRSSSCSQKVRTFLSEKGVDYVSHPVNLPRQEHVTPWFLGINPRGVVPVLVHDGVVHVESNDIMVYVDGLPSNPPSFFPKDEEERRFVESSLALEDSLHVDLRNITMGFLFPGAAAKKSRKTLAAYENAGAPNAARDKEIAWWRAFARDGGVTDAALDRSVLRFHEAFAALESRLEARPWLIGDRISVLEVAWFISVHRLAIAGYPIGVHPNLATHYTELLDRESFAREVDPGRPMRFVIGAYGAYRRARGTALRDFAKARLALA